MNTNRGDAPRKAETMKTKTNKPLTDKQHQFLNSTEIGKTYEVGTSAYSNSRATGYWSPDRFCSSATLRGLEARGIIRIDRAFWRGATVTILEGKVPRQSGRAITKMLNEEAATKGFVAEWWETGGGCDCIGVTPAEFGAAGDWAGGPHLLISPGNEEIGADTYGPADFDLLEDHKGPNPRGAFAWDDFAVGIYADALGEGEAQSMTYLKGTDELRGFVITWMDNLGFSNGALRRVD